MGARLRTPPRSACWPQAVLWCCPSLIPAARLVCKPWRAAVSSPSVVSLCVSEPSGQAAATQLRTLLAAFPGLPAEGLLTLRFPAATELVMASRDGQGRLYTGHSTAALAGTGPGPSSQPEPPLAQLVSALAAARQQHLRVECCLDTLQDLLRPPMQPSYGLLGAAAVLAGPVRALAPELYVAVPGLVQLTRLTRLRSLALSGVSPASLLPRLSALAQHLTCLTCDCPVPAHLLPSFAALPNLRSLSVVARWPRQRSSSSSASAAAAAAGVVLDAASVAGTDSSGEDGSGGNEGMGAGDGNDEGDDDELHAGWDADVNDTPFVLPFLEPFLASLTSLTALESCSLSVCSASMGRALVDPLALLELARASTAGRLQRFTFRVLSEWQVRARHWRRTRTPQQWRASCQAGLSWRIWAGLELQSAWPRCMHAPSTRCCCQPADLLHRVHVALARQAGLAADAVQLVRGGQREPRGVRHCQRPDRPAAPRRLHLPGHRLEAPLGRSCSRAAVGVGRPGPRQRGRDAVRGEREGPQQRQQLAGHLPRRPGLPGRGGVQPAALPAALAAAGGHQHAHGAGG